MFIGVIVVGNIIIIKIFEFVIYIEKMLVELINGYFDKDYLYVLEGDYIVISKLLDLKFDYIFFIGSSCVG